ncbi:MAG: hypothetical protein ACOCP8_02440 [archaeon]
MSKKENNDEISCPDCDGEITEEGDQKICSKCGLVVKDDSIKPVVDFNEDEEGNSSRRRGPPQHNKTPGNSGLKTKIGENVGGNFSPEEAQKIFQLINTEEWTYYNPDEKRKKELFKEVERICGLLLEGSENLVMYSLHLAKKVSQKNLAKGRKLEETAGAIVLITSRVKLNLYLTTKTISEAAGVKQSKISQAESYLLDNLEEIDSAYPDHKELISIVINRVIEKFNLDKVKYLWRIKKTSQIIAEELEKQWLISGKNQRGIAIACIGKSIEEVTGREIDNKKKKDLAELAGVTYLTLKKRFKEIEENVLEKEEIQEEIKDFYHKEL